MTPQEHYRHAELSLDAAYSEESGSDRERFHLAEAQIHATLSLAPVEKEIMLADALAALDSINPNKKVAE